MFRRLALIASMLTLAAPLAFAQSAPQSAPGYRPHYTRYVGLSGSWLVPERVCADFADKVWSATLEGYHFTNQTRKIAAGTEVGYYDFPGKENALGIDSKMWTVPVDLALRVFPRADKGVLSPFIQGGIGVSYIQTEVGNAVDKDVKFGTQAGFGALLNSSGKTSLKVDAVYHWIFSGNNNSNVEFWSVRAGIVWPMVK